MHYSAVFVKKLVILRVVFIFSACYQLESSSESETFDFRYVIVGNERRHQ